MPASLSRRDLLRGGGALAVATAAATLAPLHRLPLVQGHGLGESDLVSGPMRKCISLGGPGPLRTDDDPDDYRLWGNRELILESNTTWVKLWVSWQDLQGELEAAPASRAASWDQLNKAPRGESWLRRLDRQLSAVNKDGLSTIVTIFHAFPAWSSGAVGPDPVTGTKPPEQRIPIDLSPDGPWGWFIAHLCARYQKGVAPNPDGPPGNPAGAWADALEVCNEPNLLWWPQEGVGQVAAEMITTATSLSSAWDGPAILGPGTSDFPDRNQENERGLVATDWLRFTQDTLEALRGFRPTAPVHWSHHNFNDVKRDGLPSRAEQVIELLAQRGWVDRVQPLWLTEGGFNLHPDPADPRRKLKQAQLIERNFRRMARLDDVYMWTQHTISDKAGNDFRSGLREDFVEGQGPGATRPAWRAWRELPGSANP
jgi:hypothetical protein